MQRLVPLAWLAAGVLLTLLAFPPFGLWPLAAVMLAPLVVCVEGRSARSAFALAWLYSVAMGLAIARWLLHALVAEYGVPWLQAGLFATLVVSAYACVPAAALALFAALRARLVPAAAPLAFAALYVGAEWLRSALLGAPWILAGQPLAGVPLLVQGAELAGGLAVGIPVAASGAGIGLALARRSVRPLLAPLLVGLLAALWGAWRLAALEPPERRVRIGVVQAAVPQQQRFRPGSALRNTRHHIELTRALQLREAPELVVWSETAVDDDLDAVPGLARELQDLADQSGVPLLTGAPRSRGGRRTNSVVLFAPGAERFESYDKQVLVPFSESDPPFGGFLAALVAPLSEGESYTEGRDPTVFQHGPLPFSTPVCFEITYPGLIRRFRAAGAELLVNLSNDAWFGRGGYSELHLSHAIFRAVELRSWVVRAANTGISAVIDPGGRVVARLGLFEEGTLVSEVGPALEPTLYARYGDATLLTALGLLLAGPLVAGPRSRSERSGRRRRRP